MSCCSVCRKPKKTTDGRRDEAYQLEGLIPDGPITSLPHLGRKVEAGLQERILPESIYAAVIIITLDTRGTPPELVTRVLPLVFVLVLALAAQLLFAIYLVPGF